MRQSCRVKQLYTIQRGLLAPFFPNDKSFCYPLFGQQVNETFTPLHNAEDKALNSLMPSPLQFSRRYNNNRVHNG